MPEVATVLGYKNVFGSASNKTILELITGINPEILILTICRTSALLFDGKNSIEILELFTSTATKHRYRNEYFNILYRLKLDAKNGIFNEKTNSSFLKIIVENYYILDINKTENNYPLIEINFFKSYLILNEIIFDSNQKSPFEDIESEYFLEFSQIILLKKTIQFQSKNVFFYEFIKIKSLLSYYYQNEKDLLIQFYSKNAIDNPDLWILEILKLLTLHDDEKNYRFSIESHHWISEYCRNTTINQFFGKAISDIELRLNSLYFHHDQYTIINWSFFLQHLFYKIYYNLFLLYKEKYPKISNFANYKSIVSKVASEGILFRKVISKSFQHKAVFIKYDNEDISSFPDCYLRYNNSIFIFEFKDNAISDKFIDDDSYGFIKSYIDDRFIKDSAKKNKPKGISQLAAFIEYLEFNKNIDNKLFDSFKSKSIDIYPIIVVTDEMFSFPAVEFYLSKQFKN